MEYLKRATSTRAEADLRVAERVREILETIRAEGESAARQYASDLDNWSGEVVLSDEKSPSKTYQSPLPSTSYQS